MKIQIQDSIINLENWEVVKKASGIDDWQEIHIKWNSGRFETFIYAKKEDRDEEFERIAKDLL